MKQMSSGFYSTISYFILCLLLSNNISISFADGIPEPGIILYGSVLDNSGKQLTDGVLKFVYTSYSNGKKITKTTHLKTIEGKATQYSFLTILPVESKIYGSSASSTALEISSSYTRTIYLENSSIQMSDVINVQKEDIASIQKLTICSSYDSDNDSIPDAWENQIVNANLWDMIVSIEAVNPQDDFDHDGYSNFLEYQYQTDATNGNDYPINDLKISRTKLGDVIQILQLLTNISNGNNTVLPEIDANSDHKINIKDINYLLGIVAKSK